MKKWISLLLCLALSLSLVPAALAAEGAPPVWAQEAYDHISAQGVLSGEAAQTQGSISRGDFAAMLSRAVEATAPAGRLQAYPPEDSSYFADRPAGSDLYQAAAFGILEGTLADGQRYANAQDPLTREQAAKMVCSTLDFFTRELGGTVTAAGEPAVYRDAGAISAWAAPYASQVASYAIMQGDESGNFLPLAQLDWPSAVLIVSRTLALMEGGQASAGSQLGLALNSSLDWSGARAFGANDYSVSAPKTGYAQGYFTLCSADGTFSGLVVPPDLLSYDWDSQEWHSTSAGMFYVETYDAAGNVTSTKSLPMELPIFGGFLAGRDYNYLAFGQENPDQNDSQEVWRIVQYDKDWNRVGAVSASGGDTYTTEPFRSTVARMAESPDGSQLILYASRTRYDGHQSNITFLVDTQPLRMSQIMGQQFPTNHVSHSFGQFVQYDGSDVVTVDHGDAYPRSFVLQDLSGRSTDLLTIYGAVGDNVTNAIGSGFEVSQNGYLFLGCSDPQRGGESDPWNVFLAYTDRDRRNVKLTWLTSSSSTIDCARLVRVDGDTFVAMWEQDDVLHYQLLDGTGALVGEQQTAPGYLIPPTQPVVYDGRICWIQALDDGTPFLFSLPVDQT